LRQQRNAHLSVLTGEDPLFYGAVAHGADSGLLASAHGDPSGFFAVRDALVDGRLPDAIAQWE
jgi:4-hydroxy-tetrahydrodipicolinate synthase